MAVIEHNVGDILKATGRNTTGFPRGIIQHWFITKITNQETYAIHLETGKERWIATYCMDDSWWEKVA